MKACITLLILLILFVACNNSAPVKETFNDSVVKEYMHYKDSLGEIDTSEMDYKMLKAYVNDDTVALKELKRRHEGAVMDSKRHNALDSFVHQKRLQDMHVDAAYRFKYHFAFSRFSFNITITKKEDSVKLNYIEYEQYQDEKSQEQIKTKQTNKKLTLKNWYDLEKAISAADFWGLKEDNGRDIADGDEVTIYAYTHNYIWDSNQPKYKKITRRPVLYYSPLSEPVGLILKFADIKHL